LSLYSADFVHQVYSFEPDPHLFPQLKKNVELNQNLGSKISCFPIAISHKNEEQKLFARNAYGQSSSSILKRAKDSISSHSCKMVSLESFIKEEEVEKVNFVKMDIEGGEFNVLPSVGNFLNLMHYPTLMVSFHSSHLREHLLGKNISNSFLSKIFLKLNDGLNLGLYKKEIQKHYQNCFEVLKSYQYVYLSNGVPIKLDYLMNKLELLDKWSLIFSNQEWLQHD